MLLEAREPRYRHHPDGQEAVAGASIAISPGEVVGVIGPNAAGKSTLARLCCGLLVPQQGTVTLQGIPMAKLSRRERARRVAFLPQHPPHDLSFTAREVALMGRAPHLGLWALEGPGDFERARECLREMDGLDLADRPVSQLSGGERQRVALARALAVEPRVLLLDEPLGALDAQVRRDLRRWLREIHDRTGHTTLFVTHDQEEALELADRVAIFNRGRIEQVGTPDEVYQHPATPFVYEFLGDVNVFHGRGYARPYEVELFREAVQASVAATVEHVAPRGPTVRVELRAADGGATIEADLSREALQALGVVAGDRVFVRPNRLRDFAGTKHAA